MTLSANLVRQITTGTGTGNLTLIAPTTGLKAFSTFGTGTTQNVFAYFISNTSAVEWEVGTGHMSDATTLVRDTVLESSNANAKVNFSAGVKNVVNDLPASYLGILENISGTTGSNGTLVFQSTPTIQSPTLSGTTSAAAISASGQITSTVSTGTAPLVIASTTPVANLSIGGNAATATSATTTTGNAATATKLAATKNINGVAFDGSADITVPAAASTLTGSSLASGVTSSSLTSVGTLTGLTTSGQITSTVTTGTAPFVVASTTPVANLSIGGNAATATSATTATTTTGNAGTATKLAATKNINGVAFDGSADITIPAAAGTLTGSTLASGVTASSLTSTGTLTSLTTSGQITSTLATGTAPLSVASTTPVTNLNIGGNAGSATKLATARNIDGVAFDGTADINTYTATATIASNADWNTLTTAGLYKTSGTTYVNSPYGTEESSGSLEIFRISGDSNRIIQRFTKTLADTSTLSAGMIAVWQRGSIDGGSHWTMWKILGDRVINGDSNSLNSFYLSAFQEYIEPIFDALSSNITTSGTYIFKGYPVTLSGTGSSIAPNGTYDMLQLNTGTILSGTAGIGNNQSTGSTFSNIRLEISTSNLVSMLPTASNSTDRYSAFVGFGGTKRTDNNVAGLFYTDNENSGKWLLVSDVNGTETTSDTGYAYNNLFSNANKVRLEYINGSKISLYVNDVLITSVNSCPTIVFSNPSFFINKSVGTNNSIMRISNFCYNFV